MAHAIYDIDAFVNEFTGTEFTQQLTDEVLLYCQKNPFYDDAISKFGSKIFEYELEGKIEVKSGRIQVLIHH